MEDLVPMIQPEADRFYREDLSEGPLWGTLEFSEMVLNDSDR